MWKQGQGVSLLILDHIPVMYKRAAILHRKASEAVVLLSYPESQTSSVLLSYPESRAFSTHPSYKHAKLNRCTSVLLNSEVISGFSFQSLEAQLSFDLESIVSAAQIWLSGPGHCIYSFVRSKNLLSLHSTRSLYS